jgi:hypothetical protein
MRVLEKGREQKGWATETHCTGKGNGDGGCKAKLLVEEGDLYVTMRNCRDETDYFITFKCCECSVETDLGSSVPSNIRTRLIQEKRRATRG